MTCHSAHVPAHDFTSSLLKFVRVCLIDSTLKGTPSILASNMGQAWWYGTEHGATASSWCSD